MRLYGNDIDETTTPVEAGLAWTVGWEKGEFNGGAALRAQKARGVDRRLVGFELIDPGVATQGCDVYAGDTKVGSVTSGAETPFLKKAIGMAYLAIDHAVPSAEIDIDIRGRRSRARIVAMPFYKRQER